MTTQDVIDKYYGIKTNTDEQPLTNTINTSVTQILTNNPSRLAFTIINTGTNPILILNKNTVSLTNGITLISGGGNASVDFTKDLSLVTNEWYAIADGGTSSITMITAQID